MDTMLTSVKVQLGACLVDWRGNCLGYYKRLDAAVHTYGGRDGRPKSREIKLKPTGPASEPEKTKSALLAQQRAGPIRSISAYALKDVQPGHLSAREHFEKSERQTPVKSRSALGVLKIRGANAIKKETCAPSTLADPLSSYTSGTTVAVTGGKPFI